jgi:hypothetical protein
VGDKNGCLAMINNQFDRVWRILKIIKWPNVTQSRCGKLLEIYPEKTHSCNRCFYKVLTQWCDYSCKLNSSVFNF